MFKIPKNSVIRGQLEDTTDPTWLLQDMVEIDLPNGNTIDIGWHPECDINGYYRIVLFKDQWENKIEEFNTKKTQEVYNIVEEIGKRNA